MDNKNRVFHKETGAVCPLISDSYLLKTGRGYVRFPYITFDEAQKKAMAIKAHGEWVEEHKERSITKEVPETDVIVKEEVDGSKDEGPKDGEADKEEERSEIPKEGAEVKGSLVLVGPQDGEYTLAESIKGCRTFKALEAINEGAGIVPQEMYSEAKSLSEKKKLLLNVLGL